jgi:RimJ/RimL family protein N-acetyltransferase
MQLRLAHEGDLSKILETFNSDHFSMWGMRKISQAEVARNLKEGLLFNLDTGTGFLVLEDSNQHTVGFSKVNSNLAHQYSIASCGIVQNFLGQGNGKLIVQMTIDFLFLTLPIVRIEANNLAINRRIRHIIEVNGFTLEGIKRQAWFCAGKLHDQSVYGLLRSEWLQNKVERNQNLSTSSLINEASN